MIVLVRAESPGECALHTLTTQQRRILAAIEAYHRATDEPCSASQIARRLHLHHSTVQEHFVALHRKGWLVNARGPALLVHPIA